jgi:hypothetical protein
MFLLPFFHGKSFRYTFNVTKMWHFFGRYFLIWSLWLESRALRIAVTRKDTAPLHSWKRAFLPLRHIFMFHVHMSFFAIILIMSL